jgi:cytochrome c biogenesis protein CcmG, thiol:disulfide interchange protein DsbE
MKNIILSISFLLCATIVLSQSTNTFQTKMLPSIDIKDVSGNPFNTSKITNDGSPIIISFWATWCKPCIKELTAMADVYSDWQKETGVRIYAISIDDARSSSQVKPLVNGKNWDYIVLLDPNGDFKRAMNVGPIPHTFVVNGKGEVVWQHTSFSEGAELDLINLVKKVKNGEELK